MSIVQAFSISPPSLGSVGLRPSLNRLPLHHWALAILLIMLGCEGRECLNIFAPTLKFALATGGLPEDGIWKSTPVFASRRNAAPQARALIARSRHVAATCDVRRREPL